ncbi:MAG: hypothetical protein QW512_06185 [Thermofilaceae archaeon]
MAAQPNRSDIYTLVAAAALATLACLVGYVALTVTAFLLPPEPPLIPPREVANHLGEVVRVAGTLSENPSCGLHAVTGDGSVLIVGQVKAKPGEKVEVAGLAATVKCAGTDTAAVILLDHLLQQQPTESQPAQPQPQAQPQAPTPPASAAAGGNSSSVSVP